MPYLRLQSAIQHKRVCNCVIVRDMGNISGSWAAHKLVQSFVTSWTTVREERERKRVKGVACEYSRYIYSIPFNIFEGRYRYALFPICSVLWKVARSHDLIRSIYIILNYL